ncbi:TIGR01777 family oxidoreductase [Psychroserpens sp. XS_ASV72]|uniref:TIGR01777 family oxidoreductase n=1 Tax=Psychroserpens sp. XS_ASV72 TaxID=3241293 RepID=UPI003516E65D
MKRVLITGATGLIGQEIVNVCKQENIPVHYLTTSKHKLENQAYYKGFYWNPKTKEIDLNCFDGVDTIINLAGATISKRWTSDYKKVILSSRTETAQLLYDVIQKHKFPVQQIVSASAIGVYPDSQTNYYEESFEGVSDSFLGTVVQQWENAVNRFEQLGITVSKIRVGLVLSDKGGALPQIVKPVRYGVGAAFGTGEQWQSWIHIDDLAKLFFFLAENKLGGIYNGVAPNPVSNSELTKTVAKVLKKPLILPNIPKFAMKLVLGEMHILLFESQRVSSSKTESKGFDFEYHHLEPALEDLLA